MSFVDSFMAIFGFKRVPDPPKITRKMKDKKKFHTVAAFQYVGRRGQIVNAKEHTRGVKK